MPESTRTIPLRGWSTEVVEFHAVKRDNFNFLYDPVTNSSIPSSVEPLTKLFEAYTPNSEGSHNQWKDFEHYKRVCELTSGVTQVPHPTLNWGGFGLDTNTSYMVGYHKDQVFGFRGFGGADNPTAGLSVLYSPQADGHFISAPVELEALKQRALVSMLPSIRSELSGVNSLIELKDITSIKGTVTGVAKYLASFKVRGNKTIRELLRVASDVYLQKSFNIDPLLSDISGIYTALSRVERRINDLITRSAKTQRKHYSCDLNELASPYDATGAYTMGGSGSTFQSYPPVVGTCESFRQVYSEPSKFHAMIEYNFSFTQYQIEHARLLGTLDALGINLNPSIIWNALPWSFVVDWVFGVGRYLDQFTIANMEPKVNIRRFLWSIKRDRRIVTWYQLGRNSLGIPNVGHIPASVVRETAYRRVSGLPSTSSIISGGLNPKEFSLGAALVLSRRRRRKR